MKKIEPKILKGFRDFLPRDMAVRNKVIAIIKSVFESYGFDPIETPTLEYAEVLAGKYGDEADKLLYRFKDQGDRDVAMRYDLTVPLARVIAQYPGLPKPFKRYQIQPVWRADKPQKGRYREFTQCDIDSVGSDSPLVDAEILRVVYDVLSKIGLSQFTIRVNSRQVLFEIMKRAGVTDDKKFSAIQSIDKLDKMPRSAIEQELTQKEFSNAVINAIFDSMKTAQPDQFLAETISYAKQCGVPDSVIKFDPSLARGLDYYTGPIYEFVVTESKIGSLGGGGRYDDLIGLFTGKSLPACGTSFGIDRIVEVINELNLMPDISPIASKILVTIFNESCLSQSIQIAQLLRANNINAELYLSPNDKLEKQLKYADKKNIPYALICGPDEIRKNSVIMKNLRNKTQREIPIEKIAQLFE